MMYKHILLSTELSDESYQINERAILLQKLTGARLSIIHIIEPMPTVYPVGESAIVYNFQDTIDMVIEQAKKSLSKLKRELNIPDAILKVKQGYIGDEILSYAYENDVDLIITGSHGRHGVRLLLGSTANAILHGAKCDVMAVRLKGN